MLISLQCRDDIVGDEVVTGLHGVIESDMLDGEVNEIDGVMDGECNGCGVVVCEHGGDSDVEGCEVCFEVAFLVEDLAHLPLTMRRSARRETAARGICRSHIAGKLWAGNSRVSFRIHRGKCGVSFAKRFSRR